MNTADRDRLHELAATEASLRPIAMLIANCAAPQTVFDAVTKEALRRFGSEPTQRPPTSPV
jgi:hypothetical protein